MSIDWIAEGSILGLLNQLERHFEWLQIHQKITTVMVWLKNGLRCLTQRLKYGQNVTLTQEDLWMEKQTAHLLKA
ncbi:hypothetical protein PI91_21320 [Enterobacter sp. FB]|nr:hypothetical protein PI91_21320 [Enterobacter sp. FB]OIR48097.1 hypothetical protein BH716_21540 [Lelliottia nimipressuralis]